MRAFFCGLAALLGGFGYGLLPSVLYSASQRELPTMAVTSNTLYQGVDTFICEVTATLDADAGIVITHGLNGTPEEWFLTYIGSIQGHDSDWHVTDADDTTITLAKHTDGGGDSAPQVVLIAKLPHSIGR